jgi:MtN3 and saliva related transmembrane protein
MEPSIIGGLAGLLTSVAAIPQIIKTWKTKHARDLSIWQQIIIIAGLLLWLVYGIILKDIPLIASNSFTLTCYILLLTIKITFDKKDRD